MIAGGEEELMGTGISEIPPPYVEGQCMCKETVCIAICAAGNETLANTPVPYNSIMYSQHSISVCRVFLK